MFVKLWNDETGFINASNYIVMATVIAIGVVAGLTAVRDSVVQELGDLGLALENLDHSYTVNCPLGTFGYVDADVAEDDEADEPPGCIEICLPANSEGTGGGGGGGGGPLDATPE